MPAFISIDSLVDTLTSMRQETENMIKEIDQVPIADDQTDEDKATAITVRNWCRENRVIFSNARKVYRGNSMFTLNDEGKPTDAHTMVRIAIDKVYATNENVYTAANNVVELDYISVHGNLKRMAAKLVVDLKAACTTLGAIQTAVRSLERNGYRPTPTQSGPRP